MWLAALASGTAAALLVGALTGNLPQLRRIRVAPPTDRRLWLRQAGVDTSPATLVALSAGAAIAVATVVTAATGTPAVALVPAVAAGWLPRALLARRRGCRLRELQEAWPDAIRDLLASTAAGLSLHRALVDLAGRGPAPIRAAFGRYPVLARVLGVVPALEVIREELADPTSDRVLEVLILAHERGGGLLGEILRDLAETTAKDVQALEEIATDTLEQRLNARAVFVLPWLVLLVLTAQEGHFRDFYRTSGGLLVIVIGAALSTLGAWIVGRLGREPVEQRVLGGRRRPAGGTS